MKPEQFNAARAAVAAALHTVPATPANAARIMRAAGAALVAHGLPAVRTLGGVNHSSKTAKGAALLVDQYTAYLAPFNSAGGPTVCPDASPGCIASCLTGSGRASFDAKIPAARVARTVLYFASRPHFTAVLIREIEKGAARAARTGSQYFARINGTSDISPRAFKYEGRDILQLLPGVSFFDYSKVWGRASIDYGPNYSLCLSWTDGRTWADAAREVLAHGRPLAVPFADMGANGRPKVARVASLPDRFGRVDADGRELFSVPVIDGDKFDARPLDRTEGGAPAQGAYIVGLRAKRTTPEGERAALASGFFVPI